MKASRICVFSSSRADFDLLFPLIEILLNQEKIVLRVVVCGSHHVSRTMGANKALNSAFTDTVHLINATPSKTDAVTVGHSIGLIAKDLATFFHSFHPDLFVLLGDRSETLVAASVANLFGIPIVHLHGGELTLGSSDDANRHAITKLSSFHFVSNEIARNRVIQMGEHPSRVFNVGPMALSSLRVSRRHSREELSARLSCDFGDENFLVTLHPETLFPELNSRLVAETLEALSNFPLAHLFFTAANNDPGGNQINAALREFTKNSPRAWFFPNLGSSKYLSLMRTCDCVVGNSSSGIIEAPLVGTPTVNIGFRQDSRSQSESILDARIESADIEQKIREALNLPRHTERRKKHLLQDPATTVARTILGLDLRLSRWKEFFELPPRSVSDG